jgi:hypothetical protein
MIQSFTNSPSTTREYQFYDFDRPLNMQEVEFIKSFKSIEYPVNSQIWHDRLEAECYFIAGDCV